MARIPCINTAARLGFVAAALFGASGCEKDAKPKADAAPVALSTIRAEVVQLEPSLWPMVIRSQGSLFADEVSTVGAKIAGRVEQVHVDLGDSVSAGDPLVTLDQSDLKLRVEQAEAALLQARSAVGLLEGDPVSKLDPTNAPPVRQERALWDEAKSSLERAASLLDQNAISQGEYDLAAAGQRVAEARYASAINSVREKIATIHLREAELSLARQQLDDSVVKTPLDGFVQNRQVAPGTFLAIAQPIVTIVRTHPLRYRAAVPERYAQAIAVGQDIQLRVESVSQPRFAKITRVSPALDQQSRSLTFEALVDNEDHSLRTGLFATAEIIIDPDAKSLVIPDSSVIEFAGTEKVWKLVDGVAQEQEVSTGFRRTGYREVLEGLASGDVILRFADQGEVARVEVVEPSAVAGETGSTDQAAKL